MRDASLSTKSPTRSLDHLETSHEFIFSNDVFRKTCETKLAMPMSVLAERVEEEQNATWALLEVRRREELAKVLLEIALQRSRASVGAVLFNESGQFVPFATSKWAEKAVKGVRFSSSRFALDVGALEHAAKMPDPISMNEVLSRFDGPHIHDVGLFNAEFRQPALASGAFLRR